MGVSAGWAFVGADRGGLRRGARRTGPGADADADNGGTRAISCDHLTPFQSPTEPVHRTAPPTLLPALTPGTALIHVFYSRTCHCAGSCDLSRTTTAGTVVQLSASSGSWQVRWSAL